MALLLGDKSYGYGTYLFMNFFLPSPARPSSPAPRRSMVEGSGKAGEN